MAEGSFSWLLILTFGIDAVTGIDVTGVDGMVVVFIIVFTTHHLPLTHFYTSLIDIHIHSRTRSLVDHLLSELPPEATKDEATRSPRSNSRRAGRAIPHACSRSIQSLLCPSHRSHTFEQPHLPCRPEFQTSTLCHPRSCRHCRAGES